MGVSLLFRQCIYLQAELEEVRTQLVQLGISEFGGSDGATQLADVESGEYRIKYGQISLDGLRHIMLDLGTVFVSEILIPIGLL